MAHAQFVHLRVHSAYSLAEGAIKVKQLPALCRDRSMPAVAVTDTGNLFGALEISLALSEAGIQPITGIVLALEHDGGGRNGQRPPPDQLVLLAQSEAGYANLMKLSSKAFLETDPGDTPHIGWADLGGHTDGLIALTGGPQGPVGRELADGQTAAAERKLLDLMRLFPGRLYVELMRHDDPVEDAIEPALIDLAYRHDLPLVATNDAYFADADMYEAHDALLCIAGGSYVAERDRRRVTPEHRFKSAEEMRALFADLPEAVDNTLAIARRCHFMPTKHAPILPPFETSDGRTEAEELREQARAGLAARLAGLAQRSDATAGDRSVVERPYYERLDYELGVIEQMGYPGSFLIVADFMKWARDHGIPVGPGRGSGAGSVVAWSLTITDLDPLRFGLLFERFLNPERVSMPDFDIDFCQDRRDEVIDYVRRCYGDDRVAQIITFGKLQARAVLRDVGRVLQLPFGQVDRLCKLVPNNPANPVTLQQAIDGEPQLQAARADDPDVDRLISIALQLEGLYRHASTHAAGVVIGDRRLDDLVPLYRDPRSPMPVTQFNMKYVEQAGLVKFDFLGLKTLTVLERAVALVEAGGADIDLAHLPLDDRKTFEMMGRADTTGIFQFESSGMRDVLRRLKPNRFEDLIALVALYRPGPMDNIPTYIEVKNGHRQPDYLHPSLEPILTETFGIMIYQEQVMQVAQTLAGYTLGGADLLRRAMGKKIKSEMDAQKKVFVEGAVGGGVAGAQASMIFDQVAKFAGYGFNKSHAAAYALVAYQTAYLKANHPVEFMAASMTLDLGNTDKLSIFRQELERQGIRLLKPDVNRSDAVFSVETLDDGTRAIRYALAAIKGVGIEAMRAVVAERTGNTPYRDVFDFGRRLDPRVITKRQLEGLVRAGAFDSLNANRAQLMAVVDTVLRDAHIHASDRDSGQSSLFGADLDVAAGPAALPATPQWEMMRQLAEEHEALGFYLSAHPLDGKNTQRLGVVPAAEIADRVRPGGALKLAGIIAARREMTTKSGKRMAFVTLSDPTGQYEVTMFTEVLVVARPLMDDGRPLLLSVEVQSAGEDYRLTCTGVEDLDAALGRTGTPLTIFIDSDAAVRPLKGVLSGWPRGRSEIRLRVRLTGDQEAIIGLQDDYAIPPGGVAALRSLPGIADVLEG